MALDFNKIKDGVSKTYDKSIEGIKKTFRRNDDMPKQKKKKK